MQVAINPNYAEKRGLNLTSVIEKFLERFITQEAAANEQELPDVVRSLMGAAGGQLSENDLNGREAYYQ